MFLVTILFVAKVRYGFKFFNFKSHQLGRKIARIFLILYALYILYNYYYLN